jgi:hypothetical protein
MKTYYTGTSGTVKYDGGLFYDVTNWELTAELVPIEATTLADVAPRYRYARPIYAGRMNVIPANASKFETDAKRITTDLFRTAVSPSTALHELTLTTGAGDYVTTYRCRAAFSDVQFQNGIDGRPQLSIGFLVDDLLLDANWDTTEALIISTGSFALTTVPITFDYFQTNFGTLELDLTLNPIDLRYFSGALTTLALSLTMRPIELRYFALDLTTQAYTVTFNDLDLSVGSTDPFYSDIQILLKGEGTNGGTTITDSGPNNLSVATNNGATTSTAAFKYGSASLLFPDSSLFTNKGITYSIPSGQTLGTGDYTIELFFNLATASTRSHTILQIDNNTGTLLIDAQGAIRWLNQIFGPNFNVSTLTWHHLAVTRESSSVKVFFNGVQQGSTVTSTVNHTFSTLYVGRELDGDRGLWGYVDELRITKGVARYTSNFTPPTATFPEQ